MKTLLHIRTIKVIWLTTLSVILLPGCNFFRKDADTEIVIPEGITDEELQTQRYTFKRDKSYKEKFLYQNTSDSVVITIYNLIKYQIKDDEINIGEGYDYYIFDLSVDNSGHRPFNIGAFTKSCHLGNADPDFAYSNVSYALKMYYLQSDSAEIDLDYLQRFYNNSMPAQEFYRTSLFAFEVSKEEKDPLFFRYSIGNRQYEYKVREEIN